MVIPKEQADKFVEDKYGLLILKDGIVYTYYKKKTIIDLSCAKLRLETRLTLTEGKKYPVFVDLTNVKDITRQARQYLASDEYADSSRFYGIYYKSPIMKRIFYFFSIINKPKAHYRTFSNHKEAVEFLKAYVPQEIIG